MNAQQPSIPETTAAEAYAYAVDLLKRLAERHSGRTKAALLDAAVHLEVRSRPITPFDELPEI